MSEEYVARIGYYSSTMDEGDPIQLYVQADKPGKPKSVMGLNLTGIILIFMGVIFSLCGGSILFADALKKNKGKKLLANGRKIYAEVTGGRVCYNYTVNGRHPYKLECKYEDVFSGEVFLYSSGYIWEAPDIYIGSQVAVYVNPNNMAEYYVDLDSLQGALGDTGTTVHDFR